MPGQGCFFFGKVYHELLLNLAKALETWGELEVMVSSRFGNGRDDGDPVALGADVMCRGDAGDVNICGALLEEVHVD